MTPQPTEQSWRHKLTLAAVAGLVSGAARAIVTWALDLLASNS